MIETERLVLRPYVRADLKAWHDLLTDADLFRFVTAPPQSREETWNRLLRYIGHWALL